MLTPRSASMFVCMHEASSDRFDFKAAMEGYAKAGIRAVEPALVKVRELLLQNPEKAKADLTASLAKIDDFEDLMRAYGIVELQRTGRVALPKLERQVTRLHSVTGKVG